MRLTVEELNGLSRERFASLLGRIFEHSPWVAEQAWEERPFRSPQHLHETMVRKVRSASPEAILALFRAHPDLAARISMTADSMKEQRSAGLDRLSPEEYGRFAERNKAYTQKFGFPFIMAVSGKTKEEIAQAMDARIANEPSAEWRRALEEISRIAEIRLASLFDSHLPTERKDEMSC